MIGKPSSPVRREAAWKRASSTAGTSLRGRPILVAAAVQATRTALRPHRTHDAPAAHSRLRRHQRPPADQNRVLRPGLSCYALAGRRVFAAVEAWHAVGLQRLPRTVQGSGSTSRAGCGRQGCFRPSAVGLRLSTGCSPAHRARSRAGKAPRRHHPRQHWSVRRDTGRHTTSKNDPGRYGRLQRSALTRKRTSSAVSPARRWRLCRATRD
jgi:hypothetical protein